MAASAEERRNIFISYRHVEPDQTVARAAAERLAARNDIFIDWLIPPGSEWGDVIDEALSAADFVIAILSEKSVRSEMVAEEIRLAHHLRKTNGRPTLLPVRLAFTGVPPYPLGAYLNPVQHLSWTGPEDTEALLDAIERVVTSEWRKPTVSDAKPSGAFTRLLAIWKPSAELLPARERRNRQSMIERGRHDWIEGVLEKSLAGPDQLEIGFAARPGSTESGIVLQHQDEAPEPLAVGTHISDLFDDHLGQLLILGAPGSGKSTLLLQLAENLLDLAEANEALPVPVVFQLSSWKSLPGGFAGWLAHELNRRYNVPQSVAVRWVEDERILPLLDGLDEVPQLQRESCVAALNDYRRRTHGFAPIALTSRIAEYEALSNELRLPGAVVLQALTPDQIRRAFAARGIPLAPQPDCSPVWEMLDTPLMVSLATVTGVELKAAPIDAEAGRRALLERYVDVMLRRNSAFPREALLRHLGWLASQMRARSMTLFQLEDLNFDWLGSAWQRRIATTLVLATGAALNSGFYMAIAPLYIGSYVAILEYTGFYTAAEIAIRVLEELYVMYAALYALIGVLAFSIAPKAQPVDSENTTYSTFTLMSKLWKNMKNIRPKSKTAFRYALLGLPFVILDFFSSPPFFWTALVLCFCGFQLFYRLLQELQGSKIIVRAHGHPMEGVWRSFRSALAASAFSTLILLVLLLPLSMIDGWSRIYVSGLDDSFRSRFVSLSIDRFFQNTLYYVSFLIFIFAGQGGGFFVRHWAMRAILWLRRLLPGRTVAFLNAASELALLRRVGGAYAFPHRYLLEYLDERYGPGKQVMKPIVESTLATLEAAQLRKLIEERRGVTVAAPVTIANEAVEEKAEFDVVLTTVGEKKIHVAMQVRVVTGLGLKETLDLIEAAPKTVKEAVKKEEAEQIKKQVEEAGATVEIFRSPAASAAMLRARALAAFEKGVEERREVNEEASRGSEAERQRIEAGARREAWARGRDRDLVPNGARRTRRNWLVGLGMVVLVGVGVGAVLLWFAGPQPPPAAIRTFKDCDVCPMMVELPSGTFMMGSPAGEEKRTANEGPQHAVTVKPFAIGRYEVTFDEWDACVADGGCNGYRPDDKGWGRGRRPVINVSWRDTQAYVAWLKKKTGKSYRLPSEAEWEYAARAGTTTRYSFGNIISKKNANYYLGRLGRTVEVGSYPDNPWGLFDMHGNVSEWVEDVWYHDGIVKSYENYQGAPTDGSAWTGSEEQMFYNHPVARGGSWRDASETLRSASRLGLVHNFDDRYDQFGFRVARPLD